MPKQYPFARPMRWSRLLTLGQGAGGCLWPKPTGKVEGAARWWAGPDRASKSVRCGCVWLLPKDAVTDTLQPVPKGRCQWGTASPPFNKNIEERRRAYPDFSALDKILIRRNLVLPAEALYPCYVCFSISPSKEA